MNIYVSGSFSEQERLRKETNRLQKLGHYVRGSWLAEVKKPAAMTQMEWDKTLALTDIAEVYAADAIILDIDGKSTSGGRYVEWGIACAPGVAKLKIVVGSNPTGVFLSLADLYFPSWDDLVKWMENDERCRI